MKDFDPETLPYSGASIVLGEGIPEVNRLIVQEARRFGNSVIATTGGNVFFGKATEKPLEEQEVVPQATDSEDHLTLF